MDGNYNGAVLTAGAFAGLLLRLFAPLSAFGGPDIHSEYVKYLSGKDTVTAYIAYPERPQPAPAVIVIHEIFGMSDFIRQTTEQLAKDGFVAIAPDLLSRRGGTPHRRQGLPVHRLSGGRARLSAHARETGSRRQRVARGDQLLPRAAEELTPGRFAEVGAGAIQRRVSSGEHVLDAHVHRDVGRDPRSHEFLAVGERVARHGQPDLPSRADRQHRGRSRAPARPPAYD